MLVQFMFGTLRRIVLSAVLLGFVTLPAQAQRSGVNVTGKWECTYTSAGARGPWSQTVTLKQDGSTVTGSTIMEWARSGHQWRLPPAYIDIKNGAIKGDSLTFTVEIHSGQRSSTLNYAAQVTGDTMTGVQTTARGKRDFTAKRVN